MLDNARTQKMQLGLAYIKHSYTPLLFIGWILADLSKNWWIRLDKSIVHWIAEAVNLAS